MAESKKSKKKSTNKSNNSLIFLSIVIVFYIILYFISSEKVLSSFKYSFSIFQKVLPILGLIVLFMWGLKYIPNKIVKKYIGKDSGIKGWIFAAVGGMISHGPIYAWYPLLKEFREKGFSHGQVAVFLYNRAIKIPLLPMMVYYFGLKYTIVLSIVMIMISFLQGFLINIVMK